jgi:FkbH-like protein
VYMIGSCDLQYLGDHLVADGSEIAHTFHIKRSLTPLKELEDDASPIWSFNPTAVVLSFREIFLPYIRIVMSDAEHSGLKIRECFRKIRNECKNSIRIISSKLPSAAIILVPHIQPWYRQGGALTYQQGKSIEALSLELKMHLYRLATGNPRVFLVDPHAAFAMYSEDGLIRHEPFGGHPERKGSYLLLQELKLQIATLDPDFSRVKLVVFDLDETLWRGSVFEGNAEFEISFVMRARALKRLTERGVLIAAVSKNDPESEPHIRDLLKVWSEGLDSLVTKIILSWRPKADSIIELSNELNIGLQHIAFFDNSSFEREAISFALPDVKVYDSGLLATCISNPQFQPFYESASSAGRAELYRDQEYRVKSREQYPTFQEFLNQAKLSLVIRQMKEEDMVRVAELFSRTNQLNPTLKRLSLADLHLYKTTSLVGTLVDRYGDYGLIAALVYSFDSGDSCRVELQELAFSCRVMELGIESRFVSAFLGYLHERGIGQCSLRISQNNKNRKVIEILYALGFRSKGEDSSLLVAPTLRNHDVAPWISASWEFSSEEA